jgi:Holliday junction resolvasome RuvABC endonuclease subunit
LRILALDQATKTGWAIGEERSQAKYQFGSFRMPKRDDTGERLVIFRDGLVNLIETYAPDLVAFEEPYFPLSAPPGKKFGPNGQPVKGIRFNPETVKFLVMVKGVLIETTARYNLPTESFASASWRVTALGFGRLPSGADSGALKKLMIARARMLGYDVKDDNEADAIGILIHMLHGPPGALRAQGDLLDRVSPL